jgi:hypothetical protein
VLKENKVLDYVITQFSSIFFPLDMAYDEFVTRKPHMGKIGGSLS